MIQQTARLHRHIICEIATLTTLLATEKEKIKFQQQKHTTDGIPRWSPTLVLVARFSAYVWQSRRDAQFSLTYGRMYHFNSTQRLRKFVFFGESRFSRIDSS
jgi:hypothetical protein